MANGDLGALLDEFFADAPERVIMSAPAERGHDVRRVTVRRVPNGFQAERIIGAQAFHENMALDGLRGLVKEKLGAEFRQFNGWNAQGEWCISIAADGTAKCRRKRNQGRDSVPQTAEYNRAKKRLLPEGMVVPPLVDMGVFTADGKLIPSKSDKYKQINRFLEFIEDVVGDDYRGRPLSVVDFGCGKSYLTFVIYYYLVYVKGIEAHITGLDLKADVIRHCNEAAAKYGYSNLRFLVGDIGGYDEAETVDMVVTLHACDTATDYALAHAVKRGAKMILSVPCFQHELNAQMRGGKLPILCRYGIVQERMAALMTDALRANLLTACGYKTQILEFVDFEHTPKNLLIRAVKANIPENVRENARVEATALMEEFSFKPTLARLLFPQS